MALVPGSVLVGLSLSCRTRTYQDYFTFVTPEFILKPIYAKWLTMLTGSRLNTWKSRRIGWVGLAAALVALALWLAHGPLGDMLLARDETWARIQRDRVFRVGMDASYPPFEVVNEAGNSSLCVDLARALAERWGCRPSSPV